MSRYENENRSLWSRIPLWLCVAIAAYLIPFFGVVLDELWLETKWISRHTPKGTEKVFRIVYAPLLSDAFRVSSTVDLSSTNTASK